MDDSFLEILMVFPSGGDLYFTNFSYHLGSAYIIAYLKQHGFKAKQYISDETYNVNECVKRILSYNPKIVGFSVYEANFIQCVLISSGLKRYNSEIIILFGGPTPSVQSKEILESIGSVDLCVRGEGEETVLKLLLAFSNTNFDLIQTELFNINGITFKHKDKIIINPDCNVLLSNRFVKNYIDKYPSPYLSQIIPKSKAFPTGVTTARGCNQNCTYCNCAVISKRNIFFHSIERVIEELTYINDYKKFLSPVPINDDTFTILPKRAKKICEAIIENNLQIPLICLTRCDKVTEELLDLMKQAGFTSIGFSLESAVPRVLNTIGKVSPPKTENATEFDKEIEFIDKLKTMTSYAKKIGIAKVFVSIMIGLPGESLQDAQKTIKFIDKLDIDFYTHNFFHIYKGTPIYQNYLKYGYKVNPIGHKNRVHLKNSFPFDVFKVQVHPKCARIENNEILDYNTLKILSLYSTRSKDKSYFDNTIINSDVIKPSVIKCLQKNLALNGAIIQIHSDKKKFLKFHEKNRKTLYNEYSPTLYYEPYYLERSNHSSTLRSGRIALFNQQIGLPIKLKNTNLVLEEYKKNSADIDYSIGIDYDPIDTERLYNFLIELSNTKDIFKYLFDSIPLPQFQQLCRWTNNQANCQTLETAIIGNDNSIRICWYSDPIGQIGTSFQSIVQKLKNLRKETVEKRTCTDCIVNKNCLKCLFPYPLSTEMYCKFKRACRTDEPAEYINKFNLVKDFIFKPINPFEF
ncbi:MAG: B12-binding domain-containing radical SAM protein [Candidatus Hermodarchaeota archaeon]